MQTIDSLLKTPQAKFILQKIPLERKEVPLIIVSQTDLLANAASLVKSINGTYITTMDVLTAYLLMIDLQTKILFAKQLKQEDCMGILVLARHIFAQEELPLKKQVHFSGRGIGEGLTTGWTLETKKYTQDFSYKAYKDSPQIIGREKEYQQLIEGFSRPTNNNVLLIGNPGSGKENLVTYFVNTSYTANAAHSQRHATVLELMVGPLIAGAANRAELESRLQAIVQEISHSGNVILYIPEFQNIIGSSAYNVDLSGALLPYLQDGKLPVIASMSVGSFKAYLEQNPLREVFNIVKLDNPETKIAMTMLLQKAEFIEATYRIVLTYKAIQAAVQYADRYFQDMSLPGSATNLLEEVAHRITRSLQKDKRYVLEKDVINVIEEKTHISIAEPSTDEKNLLLHFEEQMHKRVIAQDDAISAIAESMRRLRSGLVSLKRPISFLFLGPTGVGKTETAKALAKLYFGGEDKMIRLDMSEYADEDGEKRLLGAPPGEGNERGELTDKIADRPFSLVLLDEFEKAHPEILDLFLQVLEDGRLTDNKGKTVSFVNSIVIATSNAGAEFIREEIQKGTAVNKDFSHRVLDYLQSNHILKPELLNRFDDVIIFKPLGESEMGQITKILLADVASRLLEQDITFTYDDKLLMKIAKDGFDQEFGARPLRRYIQDNIEDILAKKKLTDEIKRGDKVSMTVDEGGNLGTTITQ